MKLMNLHSDVLKLIVSKLDNNSIKNLSLVPGIWNEISLFAREEYFWYLRTRELASRDLSWQDGNWKEAYYILSESTVDIYNDQDNIIAASVVLSLGIDPTEDDNYLIGYASENGRVNIVRLLLQDGRADPSARTNQSIREASERGHTELARLLLQDKRVDPAILDNYPLGRAAEEGHTEIVGLLLQDRRVGDLESILVEVDRLINHAVREQHHGVRKLLEEFLHSY